ncbi:MAG: hypothetical protein N2557_03085 [Hydrogenophilus sp.]|nr:hypothetical protein [Hydrogenophilus sp.]
MREWRYPGFFADGHGLTGWGRVILDAWVFGLLPETEDCRNWTVGQLQRLQQEVEAKWDEFGGLPSLLPEPLQRRHAERYEWAVARARTLGWDPTLDPDDE